MPRWTAPKKNRINLVPKPKIPRSHKWPEREGVRYYDPGNPEGREVCLTPGAWGRRKQAVLVRDKGVCQLAKEVGREPHAINGGWTADHIKPRGLGGATRNDNMNNLRATCNRCHAIAHNLHVHAKKEGNQS